MGRKRETKWLKAARAQKASPKKSDGFDWISRALARAGVMPTRDAELAVKAGRVEVGGRTVHEPFAMVRPTDAVKVDGRPVSIAFHTRVLAFHKPAGVITADRDPEGVGTVFERLYGALPDGLRGFGWHAVGRLDRDTTGLLLFTNDERFVEHATRPETHLPKRYVALVQGTPTEERLEPLRRGVKLEEGTARPAKARVREDGRVELTLTEGKYHQVKKMLGAVGLPVRALHREAVGGLVLDLDVGAARELRPREIEDLLGYGPRSSEAAPTAG